MKHTRRDRLYPVPIIEDKHINSAIIGLWRMGNEELTIALAVDCSIARAYNTIKVYKEIKGISK